MKIKKSNERRTNIDFAVIATVVLIFGLAFFVSKYYWQLMLIQGESMEPAYHDFQLVILDKGTDKNQISDGDVIAFRCHGLDSILVKRVVAVCGQEVVIRDGKLCVDGEVSEMYSDKTFIYAGYLETPRVLTEGEYVVIGDNIDLSKDSRYDVVGIVQTDEVIGIVVGGNRKTS